MYLRRTRRRNRDGSVVTYVQLAHNRWVDGVARAEVLVNLGREDQLDLAALRRLATSIGRYLDRSTESAPGEVDGTRAGSAARPAPTREGRRAGRPGTANAGRPTPFEVPPAGLDRFVGRERELADLRPLLAAGRLLTVTGAGGVGKTRLVTEFLHRLGGGSYPGGVWWVELAPLTAGAPVVSTVAAVVQAREQPGRETRDAIAQVCGGKAGLLVLDNCEHVLDGCAELLIWLLHVCPRLRVVATSREAIRIPGETVFLVGPLAVPACASGDAASGDAPGVGVGGVRAVDSVRLFTDRAREAMPGLRWTDDMLAVVAQLCARLDGLPLAIELTARQAGVLPLPRLLERLDDQMVLLTGGTRNGPARHRSLRAAIGWSYDLLNPTEQAALRRLAVLPGGFDTQTAAAVCGDLDVGDDEWWALLRGLAGKSLLGADTSHTQAGRFTILETIRAFGRDRLEAAGEATEAHDRVLTWLTGLAELLLTEIRLTDDMRSRFRHEQHNLEYAVQVAETTHDDRYPLLAAALSGVLAFQGEIQRAHRLVEQLATGQRADPAVRSLALAMLVNVLNESGEYSRARGYAEQSLELARQLGTRALIVKALSALSDSCRRLGDVTATVVLHRQLVEIMRRAGQPVALADHLNGLAWALMVSGQLPAADRAVAEALSYLDSHDAPYSVANTAHTAGMVALLRDHLDQASAYFTFSVLAPTWAAHPAICNLDGFALVAARSEQPERALRLLSAAETARTEIGAVNEEWMQHQCDRAAGLARDRLSGIQASTATADGAALSLEQAVAYALTDQWPRTSRPGRPSVLTPREQQVAELVAEGLTNLQIAARLGVSIGTVATHLKSIRAKLDLATRAHIAAWIARQQPGRQSSPTR